MSSCGRQLESDDSALSQMTQSQVSHVTQGTQLESGNSARVRGQSASQVTCSLSQVTQVESEDSGRVRGPSSSQVTPLESGDGAHGLPCSWVLDGAGWGVQGHDTTL